MGNNKDQALAPGTILRGPVYTYTIEKVLGQGAFGITYLASFKVPGPLGEVTVQAALKEFFAKELDSRQWDGTVSARTETGVAFKYAKAFQRESENLSKMKHPGIVNVLEAFEAKGTYYYSMEYLSGGSLDDKVKGVGLPEAAALPLIGKIGEALSYMHERKMMHLDLKPRNIMLKGDGTPVIIDFGLSKQFDSNGEPESTSTIGLGTPGYAPLEQANRSSGNMFQPTMDIYALGATLYKMLTGETAPNASQILNDGFPESRLKDRGVSDGTIGAIKTAMAPIRKDRFQSVSSFLAGLGNEEETLMNGILRVESKPSGAEIILDGAPSGKRTPYVFDNILEGDHTVRLKMDGFKDAGGDAHVRANHESSFSRTLEKESDRGGGPSGTSGLKPFLWALLAGLVVVGILLGLALGGKGKHKQEQKQEPVTQVDTVAVVTIQETESTPAASPATSPAPVSEQAAFGSVKVSSTPPGATIWLDGKNTRKTTPEILEDLTPGKHSVKLVLDGYEDYTGSITVTSGKRTELSKTLTAKQEPSQEQSPQPVASASETSKDASAKSSGTINGHEWVDLGLSVKWATCNVGASSPSGYGSYFAWGETRPKSEYTWSTLKYCSDDSGDSFTKYNMKSEYGPVDNKTRLDLSDDAARSNWGGSWRIPTDAEWTDLRNNCTWTWTNQNGTDGYKVTSKKNGNSIFLPAAGYRNGTALYDAGSYGLYWSSTLNTGGPSGAYGVYFNSSDVGRYVSYRVYGLSVRPVTE